MVEDQGRDNLGRVGKGMEGDRDKGRDSWGMYGMGPQPNRFVGGWPYS